MEALQERGLLLPERAAPGAQSRRSSCRTTTGGRRPSTASASSSTTCSPASTASAARAILSREETLERLPTIQTEGLRGGVVYYDGQFDDSRLLIHLVDDRLRAGRHAAQLCAGHRRHEGRRRLRRRRRSATSRPARSSTPPRSVVINATGAFTDDVRRMADPAAEPMIAPSQGVHLVFDALVPRRRQRHHGAAHQRRPGDVRDPVARPHARRHHRHAHRRSAAGARRPRAGDRVHPADRRALPGKEADPRRRPERLRGHPPVERRRRRSRRPRPSRAITPSASSTPAW